MQQPAPRLVEVALAASPRGDALFRSLADPRVLARPSRLSLALGGRCPVCGRPVVAAVAGDWTADGVAAVLRAAGRCLHEAPAPSAKEPVPAARSAARHGMV